MASLEASSAGLLRHRLNRGGNRRLNAILYRIAVVQARFWPPAQAYLARRALKRYLIRAIWQLCRTCHKSPFVEEPAPISPGAFSLTRGCMMGLWYSLNLMVVSGTPILETTFFVLPDTCPRPAAWYLLL